MNKRDGRVLFAVVLSLFLFAAAPTLACLCPYSDGPLAEQVNGGLEISSAVFVGKVTGFEYRPGSLYKVPGAAELTISEAQKRETKLVKFEVLDWWKMAASSSELLLITDSWRLIKTADETASRDLISLPASDISFGCGISFVKGESYLIYASGPAESLQYRMCSRTARLDRAADDLKVLGEGQKPVKP